MSMLNIEQDRASKLAELGSRLRQIRQEKAISLEQVSAQTMIQSRLLHAIEEGKLDQLPEPVYTQGFIRRFAEALGLNGAEFAQDFPTRLATEPRYKSSQWRELPAAQLRPIHLYILYIIVISTAVSGLSFLVNRSAVNLGTPNSTPNSPPASQIQGQLQQRQVLQSSNETISTGNSTSTQPPQTSATPGSNSTTSAQQSVQAEMSLTAPSWIEIIVDGKTEYEGVLPQGTKRTLTAKESLTLRAGNAGGVLVAVDQQQPKPMGEAGTVKELTLTSEGNTATEATTNN